MADVKSIKQTQNEIVIAGQLLKSTLECKKAKEGSHNIISGDLTVKTIDGSEVEVSYYANEFKKDPATKNFSTEVNGIYKSLQTVMNDFKTVEKFKDEADLVKIKSEFTVNDYKSSKDGQIKSIIKTKANFANRIESETEKESTPFTASFAVEGVVVSVLDEEKAGELTGCMKVSLNIIGYQGSIIPITLTSKPEHADYIRSNYEAGQVVKFWGVIVNTAETREEVVEGGFGESYTKTITNYTKKYEITGGGNPLTFEEFGLEESNYRDALAKRKLKLDNLLKEERNSSTSNTSAGFGSAGFGSQTQTQTPPAGVSNPFGGQPSSTGNPFAR